MNGMTLEFISIGIGLPYLGTLLFMRFNKYIRLNMNISFKYLNLYLWQVLGL